MFDGCSPLKDRDLPLFRGVSSGLCPIFHRQILQLALRIRAFERFKGFAYDDLLKRDKEIPELSILLP